MRTQNITRKSAVQGTVGMPAPGIFWSFLLNNSKQIGLYLRRGFTAKNYFKLDLDLGLHVTHLNQ